MYSSYFGFSEKPFEVTPDPRFLYLTPSHKEMLASLVYGINERRGFIVVSGEVGTGKTTLINAALDRLEQQTKVAYICNTAVSFDQLLEVSLMELGLIQPGASLTKVQAIHRLNEFTIEQLANGGNVVLIVDEAQNLDNLSLENLRLLSNLETRKHKLIQIILAGQPELDVKLNRPELRQLAQRISVRRSVKPLREDETHAYIRHRLTVAGAKNPGMFGSKVREKIYKLSGGFPRKINVLCDNALLIAYGMDKKTIDTDILEEAARDLGWIPMATDQDNALPHPVKAVSPPVRQRSRSLRVVLVAAIALFAGILLARWMPLSKSSSFVHDLQDRFLKGDSEVKLSLKNFDDQASHRSPSVSRDTEEANQPGTTSESVAPNPSLRSASEQTPLLPKHVTPFTPGQGRKLPDVVRAEEQPPPPSVNPIALDYVPKSEKTDNTQLDHSTNMNVTVQKNQTLSGIIVSIYGEFHPTILDAVMRENPQILSPNHIYPGQVIRIPSRMGRVD